jgi:hypothetical protein
MLVEAPNCTCLLPHDREPGCDTLPCTVLQSSEDEKGRFIRYILTYDIFNLLGLLGLSGCNLTERRRVAICNL